VETEVKYSVPDGTVFAALLGLRALGDFTLRPMDEQDLIDHYVDTPDRDLLRGGYTCRLREGEQEGRWRLTVKGRTDGDGAWHEREEYESDIPPHTAPAEWPSSEARELVIRLSEGHTLVELFNLHQHRVRRAVEYREHAVGVLALDTVEMDIGGNRTVAHEIELELTATGAVGEFRAVSTELEAYRLTAQPKSKFERALAILDGASSGFSAKEKKTPGVRADEPMAEAGRKILRFHFQRMLANEDGTRKGKDIEALHDMRVATRRQRAIFRIAAPYFKRRAVRPFQAELQTLARHLGAVRDLDVLIEAAESYQSSPAVDNPKALEPLLDEWRKRRNGAREELTQYLNGDSYQTFTTRYRAFLRSPGVGVKNAAPGDSLRPYLVRHILPAGIWDQYGRVRAYETMVALASIETIHALRIEAKRLRYLLEFFREVLRPGCAEAIEAIVALQDHTGELHDTDVTVGLLRDFLMRRASASLDPAVSESVGGYLKIKLARLGTLRRTLRRPWRRVTSKRFRRTLAGTVAEL
jgi:CHAD domain-containing protein